MTRRGRQVVRAKVCGDGGVAGVEDKEGCNSPREALVFMAVVANALGGWAADVEVQSTVCVHDKDARRGGSVGACGLAPEKQSCDRVQQPDASCQSEDR